MNVWYSKLGFDGEVNTMFVKRNPLQVIAVTTTNSLETTAVKPPSPKPL